MEIHIPKCDPKTGFKFSWEEKFSIFCECKDNKVHIVCNKEGLISLAKQLLTLSEDVFPAGYHVHYDAFNSLEDFSNEIIIEKIG